MRSEKAIVPNGCEDGHDRCGTKDQVEQFDDFLEREVPKIQSSPVSTAKVRSSSLGTRDPTPRFSRTTLWR